MAPVLAWPVASGMPANRWHRELDQQDRRSARNRSTHRKGKARRGSWFSLSPQGDASEYQDRFSAAGERVGGDSFRAKAMHSAGQPEPAYPKITNWCGVRPSFTKRE